MVDGAHELNRRVGSMSDATVAGPEEAMPVGGRVGAQVEGQSSRELLAGAERDEVEREARAANATALGEASVTTAHGAWEPVQVT